MEPVGNFNENDPNILTHGDEHFPEILHLLIFLGGILDTGQLADALHQIRHSGRGELGHILIGGVRVLNDIVEQSGLNGFGIEVQLLRHDLRHGQRVRDIRLAAFAALLAVMCPGKFVGRPDAGKIRPGIVRANRILQLLVLLVNAHHHDTHLTLSPRRRAAGADRERRSNPPSLVRD